MQSYPNHVACQLPKRDRPGVNLAVQRTYHQGPWCLAQINTHTIALRKRDSRRRVHQERGLTYDQCGLPATHEIDGQTMCERHAGRRALEILVTEQ